LADSQCGGLYGGGSLQRLDNLGRMEKRRKTIVIDLFEGLQKLIWVVLIVVIALAVGIGWLIGHYWR